MSNRPFEHVYRNATEKVCHRQIVDDLCVPYARTNMNGDEHIKSKQSDERTNDKPDKTMCKLYQRKSVYEFVFRWVDGEMERLDGSRYAINSIFHKFRYPLN